MNLGHGESEGADRRRRRVLLSVFLSMADDLTGHGAQWSLEEPNVGYLVRNNVAVFGRNLPMQADLNGNFSLFIC